MQAIPCRPAIPVLPPQLPLWLPSETSKLPALSPTSGRWLASVCSMAFTPGMHVVCTPTEQVFVPAYYLSNLWCRGPLLEVC